MVMTSAPTPAPVRRDRARRPVSRPDRVGSIVPGGRPAPDVAGAASSLAIAVLYPLLWMVFSSFKDNSEVFNNPWGMPGELRWHNFAQAGNAGVVRYFTNSVIVTVGLHRHHHADQRLGGLRSGPAADPVRRAGARCSCSAG